MLRRNLNLSPVERTIKMVRAAGSRLAFSHAFFGPAWAWVTVRVGPVKTACIDARGVMTVDPDFWAKQDKETRVFVIAHELCHLILMHHRRRGGRHAFRWNCAGDRWINAMLKAAGFKCPDWVLYPLEAAHADLAIEDIYELEPKKDDDKDGGGKPGDGPGKGEPKPGELRPGEGCGVAPTPDEGKEPEGSSPDQDGKDGKGEGEGEGSGPGQAQENDERTVGEKFDGDVPDWGRIGAQCAAASQGSGSGKVLRRTTEPPPGRVRADKLLRHAFSQARAAHGRDDFTWRKRSRRALDAEGPILPGFTANTATAALVIDTSGSMGDEAITQIIKWSTAIGRECGVAVFVVAHTHRAYYAKWVDPNASTDDFRRILDESGGTSFVEALEKVGEVKKRFDVMVQFTDGECRWPDPHKPRNVRRHIIGLVGTRSKRTLPKSGVRVIDATLA